MEVRHVTGVNFRLKQYHVSAGPPVMPTTYADIFPHGSHCRGPRARVQANKLGEDRHDLVPLRLVIQPEEDGEMRRHSFSVS
jgi:hypothetical protein